MLIRLAAIKICIYRKKFSLTGDLTMPAIWFLLMLFIVSFLFSFGFVALFQKKGRDWIHSALSCLGLIGVILSLMYLLS